MTANACRMRSSACDTLMRLCVRHVLCWPAFPLVSALRSTGSVAVGSAADCSAADRSTLFTHALCTLRVGVTAASRNTRFQAARYGFTWAGLAPADRASFAWRLPSLNHLIGSRQQRRGHGYCAVQKADPFYSAERFTSMASANSEIVADARRACKTSQRNAARHNSERQQLSAYRLTQGGAGVRWTDLLKRLDLGATSGGNHVAIFLSPHDG